MNIFFFLNHYNLDSSLDIFNFPPNNKFCPDNLVNLYPYAFYSDGDNWKYFELDTIKKNKSMIIKKSDLPKNTLKESVFVSFSLRPNAFEESLKPINYMNSAPAWRANTKIKNGFTSASYQGEYPGALISKNISLVSCSPMIQSKFDTYFYLINLTNNPRKENFELNFMDTKFNILGKLNCLTNTINHFRLNEFNYKFTDNFYVFKSNKYGGIPLYFTKSDDSKKMGIEHTHPPMEYIFLGNRNHFQKLKKRYWLDEQQS